MSEESQLREDAMKLSCRELVDLVTEYDEDVLQGDRRRQFEAHLQLCVGCQHHLDQMHEASHVAERLRQEEVAPETRAKLMQLFRDWKAGEAPDDEGEDA